MYECRLCRTYHIGKCNKDYWNKKSDEHLEKIERVKDLAKNNCEHIHHAESKTHLYWAIWLVPYGARGCGTYANDAYVDYMNNVEFMLDMATERDLDLWLAELEKVYTKKQQQFADLIKSQLATENNREEGSSDTNSKGEEITTMD